MIVYISRGQLMEEKQALAYMVHIEHIISPKKQNEFPNLKKALDFHTFLWGLWNKSKPLSQRTHTILKSVRLVSSRLVVKNGSTAEFNHSLATSVGLGAFWTGQLFTA